MGCMLPVPCISIARKFIWRPTYCDLPQLQGLHSFNPAAPNITSLLEIERALRCAGGLLERWYLRPL